MHQRLLSNARPRHAPRPLRYTPIACRLRKARGRPKPRSWFDAYVAALRSHSDAYEKPIVDDHQLAEHLAAAPYPRDATADAIGNRTALAMVFLAGVMLALVTARAVAPASAMCAAPTAPVQGHDR